MANEIEKNIYLVNAPAGSGKTTKIKSMIRNHTVQYPNDNILCITYTNRAADELKKDIDSQHIFISTIHSFINNLVSPLLSLGEIIDLYWEFYYDKIESRIRNIENDDNVTESNKKYIDKNGQLSISFLKDSIKRISYGETQFNSLYYGKLSHDDLLSFTRKIIEKYPKVMKKISNKYQVIFIDEYQDTSSDVLNIFYKAVKDTKTRLYFLGDKMQQIYKTYDGSFEDIFSKLNTEISLNTNHRSIPVIIDLLNALYNNPKYKQEVYEKNKDKQSDYHPRIILSDNIQQDIDNNLKEYPDSLVLYLFNKKRFEEIGALSLWNTYSSMEQYSFGKKFSSTDVLTDISSDNPDDMMRLLFTFNQANELWENQQYGNLIALCKKNKKYFNINNNSITKHSDKIKIKKLWEAAFKIYTDNTKTIGNFISYLTKNEIIEKSYMDKINPNKEYDNVLGVAGTEVISLYKYLKEPHISTQHGVKGESHNTVVFVADDSYNTPIAHMYKFFEVWSKTEFSLNKVEEFYFSYKKFICDVEAKLEMKTTNLKKPSHDENKAYLIQKSEEIIKEYENNNLFENICKNYYLDYLNKQTVKNAQSCFKDSTVYGVLSAYRLFYVGCSRARKNLTIIVDKNKLINFLEKFKEKAKKVGFEIQ